jgi:F-type H+-transporting ATPase subunit delta
MKHSRAAVRYAKATLEFAREHKAVEAVEEDMRVILKTISASPSLHDMLASPVVGGSVKKKALQAVFPEQHAVSDGLISLLVDNKRISLLNEVALKYVVLYEELKGRDIAYITTAVPLTAEIEQKALAKLASITDRKLTLEKKVDKDILGGFVLRVGDIQYDASIASKLNMIKREFIKNL